jgi:predicted nuclease with TOPRIM domain
MSTIKELADYVSEFSNLHSDSRIAGELKKIQTMISQIQREQTGLIEKRIELMKENEDLRKVIDKLNKEVAKLKNTATAID